MPLLISQLIDYLNGTVTLGLPIDVRYVTRLPVDGRKQPERFTNPNHPQFWRSDDPGSPAYRGAAENPDGDRSE
jgi:hypothetical protein